MSLNKFKEIHFVGIKGVGMTSLALCAKDLGIKVTGSDIDELFVTDEILKKAKISWKAGFSPANIASPDLVITTGAHGGLNNIEVKEAKKKKIPVLTQAEALSLFSENKKLLAVCGVGGKTTVASILAVVLTTANFSPSYAVGVGKINPIGFPGKYSKKGVHFICEADEFVASPGVDDTPKFLYLNPEVLVVTNIEHDHPDIYKNLTETKEAYLRLLNKIPTSGLIVANIDNENTKEVVMKSNKTIKTYGFSKNADWRIKDYQTLNERSSFSLVNKEGEETRINLKVPGRYNVENATAAFIVGDFVGVEKRKIVEGLESFGGTQRRFEKIGVSKSGIKIYDDYAHHPDEIKEVLSAAKEWFGKARIVSVFQPHTYTRTKALFKDFASSFKLADTACFMDIYSSAREKKDKSVSSLLLAKESKKHNSNSYYTGNHKETIKWIKENVKKGDILLTLGAGDIFYIHQEVLKI